MGGAWQAVCAFEVPAYFPVLFWLDQRTPEPNAPCLESACALEVQLSWAKHLQWSPDGCSAALFDSDVWRGKPSSMCARRCEHAPAVEARRLAGLFVCFLVCCKRSFCRKQHAGTSPGTPGTIISFCTDMSIRTGSDSGWIDHL